MSALSQNMKKELANALEDKKRAMFMADGKLISLEVHENDSADEFHIDIAHEIELYPELKESLQHYLDKPHMKRYTAKELKELRYDQRK